MLLGEGGTQFRPSGVEHPYPPESPLYVTSLKMSGAGSQLWKSTLSSKGNRNNHGKGLS